MKSYGSARVRHDAREFDILDDFHVLPFRSIGNAGACSTSSPSGNLVGGLPLVAHSVLPESNTGEDRIGPAPDPKNV